MRIDSRVADARARELARFLRLAFDNNKAALGRRLGYADGSFVGQMLRGEKAITEVTWARICDLHEVRPFINADTPVYQLSTAIADQPAAHLVGEALVAYELSHRQPIVTPKTLVWEDLVLEDVDGQFIMMIQGDALAPQYLPGQSGIWQAGSEGRPGQPVLLVDAAGTFHLRLYEPRGGGSWAGVSQRVGHRELTPERDQARVVARLRYLDLG